MQHFQQDSCPVKKNKRIRSAFTTSQMIYLENEYKKCHYINPTQRKGIADKVNLPDKVVKVWFQNRRMREKKELYPVDNYEEDDGSQNLPFLQDLSNYPSTSRQDASFSLPPLSNNEVTNPQPGTSKQFDSRYESSDKDNEEPFLTTNEGSTLFPYYIDISRKNEHSKQDYPEKAKMKATGNTTKSIDDNRENPLDLSVKNSIEKQGNITATANKLHVYRINPQSCMHLKNVIDKPGIPTLGQDIPTSIKVVKSDKTNCCKCKCKKKGNSWPILFQSDSTTSQYIITAIEIPNSNPPE